MFVDEEVDAAKEVDKVRMEKEMSQKSQKKGVKWVGEEEGVGKFLLPSFGRKYDNSG